MEVALLALWFPLLVLAAAAVVDLRTKQVPDVFALALVAFAIACPLFGWTGVGLLEAALGLVAGAACGFALCRLLSFGAADALLLAALGAIVGPRAFSILLVAIFLCGFAFALRARLRGEREMAYVPAIAGGYFLFVSFLTLLSVRGS